MQHHVLRWTGSPSEDHPSVSNVSTQSQHPPGYLPGLLAEPYSRPPSDAPSAGHEQPPGLYDRPQQPSVSMMVPYSICSNINFDYCSHCLLDLWSLPTSSDSCNPIPVSRNISDSQFIYRTYPAFVIRLPGL